MVARHESGLTGRRKFLKYAGGAGTLLVAGCSGNTPQTATEPGKTSTPQKRTPYPSDYLDGETIKLGVVVPRPTDHEWGISAASSAEMAVEALGGRTNNEGFLGADVEILLGDTKLSPAVAKKAHRRLTFEQGADVTFGPMLTPSLMNMLDSVAQQKVLNFSLGPTGLPVTEAIKDNYEKYKYQFRPGVNQLHFGQSAITFMKNYGSELWDSAAVLTSGYENIQDTRAIFEGNLSDHIDITMYENVSQGQANYTPVYDAVENSGADVAYMFTFLADTPAIKQWANEKRPFALGGFFLHPQLPGYYEEVGGVARYSFTMTQVTPQSELTPKTQPYYETFIEKEGFAPIFTGPLIYDAIHMYAQTVRATGTTDSDALVPYLEQDFTFGPGVAFKSFEFQGPDGRHPHDWDWPGMEKAGVPSWLQWQEKNGEGVQAVIAPDVAKTADYQRPPWVPSG